MLVSALASSTLEATRENCAIAMGNVSFGGAWCCLRGFGHFLFGSSQLHGCMRCRPCRCARVLLCARSSSCVYVLYTDFVLLAGAHHGAIVAAGALPALVSARASSTSEATREECAVALQVMSWTGAWCRKGLSMWPGH